MCAPANRRCVDQGVLSLWTMLTLDHIRLRRYVDTHGDGELTSGVADRMTADVAE